MSASPWVREECPGAQRRLLNSASWPRSEVAATPTSVKLAEGRESLPKLGKGDEGRIGALWPPPHPGALRLLGKGASIPRPVGVLPLPSPGSRKGTRILREQSPRSPRFLDSKHKRGPVAALTATADFESSSGLG